MKAEEEREKMRASMNTMSKQIAANAAMIAESAGKGPNAEGYDYSAKVFACQSGNANRYDPLPSGPATSSSQRRYDDNHPNPASKKTAPTTQQSNAGAVPSTRVRSGPGGPSNAVMSPQLKPMPQRERGQADRSSNTRGQGPGPVSRAVPDNVTPNSAIDLTKRTGPPMTLPGPSNTTEADSWADDIVSDAELIYVSDETGPTTSAQSRINTAVNSGPPGGTEVGGAPVSAGPSMNLNPPLHDQRRSEKRGRESNSEPNGNRESYAGVTKYRWRDVENKRTKRNNSDDGSLLGVKATPHKEIFVKHLDYSRCAKPADLEGRVKMYCRKRNVFILQVRVFEQSDCNRANVRISLKIEDVDSALSPDFWPQHAVARIWSINPQQDVASLNDAGIDDAFAI